MDLNFKKSLAIIVAAGSGTRANTQIPKQFMPFLGKTLISHSVESFIKCDFIGKIIIVIPQGDEFHKKLKFSNHNKIEFIHGGETRAKSVGNALKHEKENDYFTVFIHDAARPGIDLDMLNLLQGKIIDKFDGALPALNISDALWIKDDDILTKNQNRDNYLRAQTPQAFDFKKYYNAFFANTNINNSFDDAQIAVNHGLKIGYVAGNHRLDKITNNEDFQRLGVILENATHSVPRIGNGFDAHRFCDGVFVTICGEKIPHEYGLLGHSDADVAWHALVDAILGALAEGDIGKAFPPSEEKWKGAPSSIFLEYARDRLALRNAKISNIDLTIICEAPKIGPHSQKLAQNTADILNIPIDLINIKATTTEKMGFTGRKEGIAAMASICILMNG
ncbi:MAG: 2-C-methyl-D-erythritol 2,4-cyclodiphosphate synthase [Caulobacterales bacterium]|nr:2-C-methyl-D-erythritol 2,4-cyclodiphosphate synthase [Caulobacterales bacterium]MCA0373114.1 2-C-methyl-D-erythritol 2,4-cyclodiphosphate synthase [Pseudomonadota bacterium]